MPPVIAGPSDFLGKAGSEGSSPPPQAIAPSVRFMRGGGASPACRLGVGGLRRLAPVRIRRHAAPMVQAAGRACRPHGSSYGSSLPPQVVHRNTRRPGRGGEAELLVGRALAVFGRLVFPPRSGLTQPPGCIR